MVSYDGKKSLQYYAGKIIDADLVEKEVTTTFVRRAGSSKVDDYLVFVFPEVEDVFIHCMSDIAIKLPLLAKGKSKRAARLFIFQCSELNNYVIDSVYVM